jgi:nitroreductase
MTAPPAEPLDVIDALHSTPSRRYLSDRPIEEAVLWAVLDAAVRGPSGGNRQGWAWIVIGDDNRAAKTEIAGWYREAWQQAYGYRREEILSAEPTEDGLSPRSFLAADHLADHLEEAPIWVIPVLLNAAHSTNPRLGASVYGAAQQLMLAARAYGIGSTLTTLHAGHEDDVRALLGLPADALTMALIPMGYPARGNWSQPKRRTLEEVVHWGTWGATRERTGVSSPSL